MNIIETHDLRKRFKSREDKGKRQLVEAVKGVSMNVEKGEIFGFLGPNGAGKTTTLRMLSTLLQPTSGDAKVVGYDLHSQADKIREKIGYVSQAGGADTHSSAVENLMLQAQLYGMDKQSAKKRTEELIVALQLDSFAKRLAKTYSGGQKRRLDLALGMVNNPDLLFLDEPTTGLDPQSRAHLWEEVRKLRESGTTVFLTTHYLDEADVLADRLAIMDGGTIVAEGTPNTLKQQIAGDVVTLGVVAQNGEKEHAFSVLRGQSYVREIHDGTDAFQLYVERGEETLPAILRLMDGEGLKVNKVSLARPTLDDVFLRQTGRSLRETSAN
ncbi:MAG: ATP-binding cassette domain-containing protein [Chloroflexi bacterium]|nr:ATP-binding cassette domain-containing protein [Chloroflexota bacterium]MCC6895047.1 ATP-binding cassette domain-containing protein [Anaerolineae bacterium]